MIAFLVCIHCARLASNRSASQLIAAQPQLLPSSVCNVINSTFVSFELCTPPPPFAIALARHVAAPPEGFRSRRSDGAEPGQRIQHRGESGGDRGLLGRDDRQQQQRAPSCSLISLLWY
eukprot:2110572-Pyramimonas_sp.AAC.1